MWCSRQTMGRMPLAWVAVGVVPWHQGNEPRPNRRTETEEDARSSASSPGARQQVAGQDITRARTPDARGQGDASRAARR